MTINLTPDQRAYVARMGREEITQMLEWGGIATFPQDRTYQLRNLLIEALTDGDIPAERLREAAL